MVDPTVANAALEAAREPLANLTNPPTRSIGKFFGDTLDFWFSNRELKYAQKRIMDELALRKFREECEAEFANIPEEDLIPPRKALLLPALDAAEYYVEEEELRKMFARLVAACCDGRKASKVHPSFAAIIQDLSPLDAECLTKVEKGRLIQIDLEFEEVKTEDYGPLKNFKLADGVLENVSFSNLFRLGLISEYTFNDFPTLYLTYLGRDFCSVCLPPSTEEAIS